MIKASIYKPITMLMVILTVVVFGLYTYSMMVVDLMPKFEVPVVTATMVYAGANPEEIETTVIKPVEEQVELVDGIDYVQSICLENYGIIIAMFNMGVNVDVAANDVRSKVELASANFPDAVEAPIISKVDINGAAIMAVSFTCNYSVPFRKLSQDFLVCLEQVWQGLDVPPLISPWIP